MSVRARKGSTRPLWVLVVAVVAGGSMGAGVSAAQPADVVPLDRFLVLPQIREVALSPGGENLAYVRRETHGASLWLYDTAGDRRQRRLDARVIDSVHWSRDGEGLFVETPDRIAYLAAGQGRARWVLELDELLEQRFLAVDPVRPRHLLVAEKAGDQHHRLLRVGTMDEPEVVLESDQAIRHFLLGGDGSVRYLKEVEGLQQVILRLEGERRDEVLRCSALDVCRPITYLERAEGPAAERLFMLGRGDEDLAHLYSVEVEGSAGGLEIGPRRLVHRDPEAVADLRDVALDPASGQPLLAVYDSDRRRAFGLRPEAESVMASLRRSLAGARLEISPGAAGAPWLVTESGPRLHHPRHLLYDPASGHLRRILEAERSEVAVLPQELLVEPRAMTYRASDGLVLHGLVFVPPGVVAGRAPVVMRVHGGPWKHARRRWSAVTQMLVNRGYIVFEPNFRSSTGFGLAYLRSAAGDFGDGRVQQDMLEGLEHLHAQGLGDPEKVAVIGHSFGGFSTLGALAFTPRRFVAGVASAPPIDLVRAVRDLPEDKLVGNGLVQKDVVRELMVDLDDPRAVAELRRQSPELRLADTERPLLILGGGRDEKVDIIDVKHYAAALDALGKDVSLLIDEEQGHSFDNEVSLGAYLYLLERFLGHHLGGPVVATEDPRLARYVEQNLRLTGPSLEAALGAR